MRSGGKSGGINSGEIDSFCMGSPKPLSSAPGPGVSTNALGSSAPAYYEVGEPTGAYLGQPPKGVMFVIHGGGWYQTGAGRVVLLSGEPGIGKSRLVHELHERVVASSHRAVRLRCSPYHRHSALFPVSFETITAVKM